MSLKADEDDDDDDDDNNNNNNNNNTHLRKDRGYVTLKQSPNHNHIIRQRSQTQDTSKTITEVTSGSEIISKRAEVT
jgi:hypothetical protein